MPDDLDEDEERPRRSRRREPDDFEDEERPRPRRKREADFEATEMLIPTGVSAYSMAACYFGLFSCFIPVLGLLMALIALPCGIAALKRRKKKATYGAVTGDIRAVVGIVCSSLTLLGYLAILILYVVSATAK
jgi:hypothetical protein